MHRRLAHFACVILVILTALWLNSCNKDDLGWVDEIESIKASLNQYQALLEAVSNKLTIVSVNDIGAVHIITFSDGSTLTITDGGDGVDGRDGKDAPYITDIVDNGDSFIFRFSNGDSITVPRYGTVPQRFIACWGDSFTAGAGKKEQRYIDNILKTLTDMGYHTSDKWRSCTYPQYLELMLGDGYKSWNLGVGGETNYTIAARMGANPPLIGDDFVLPADGSAVRISDGATWFDSPWGGKVKPLLQGQGASVNPCYIDGIECTLKWTGKAHDDTEGTYTIARNNPDGRDVTIVRDTPIIMYGAKAYRDVYISVIWAYQNGGYTSNEALVWQLRKMVQTLPNNNYIILGIHTGNYASRHEQEAALEAEFGVRFLNLRRYFSTNAIYDFGVTPDETDLEKMAEGSIPPAFLYDKVHLTAAGYAIVAYKLIERFSELGYI